MSLVVAASVAATPAFGWRPVIPLAVVAAAYAWSRPRLARFRRPEYVIAANWLFAEVMVACAVALARGPRLLILPVFCFPMMLGSVVFPRRAVAAGAAIAAALMVATALIVSAGTVAHTPPTLVYPLVMLVCTAIWAEAASAAEAASRGRR